MGHSSHACWTGPLPRLYKYIFVQKNRVFSPPSHQTTSPSLHEKFKLSQNCVQNLLGLHIFRTSYEKSGYRFCSLANLIEQLLWYLGGPYWWSVGQVACKWFLTQEGAHLLADLGRWHYQVPFHEASIVQLQITTVAYFDAPIALEVKVQRLGLRLLLTSTWGVLAIHGLYILLLLHPRQEARVELPPSTFELLSGQVLLISSLLVVKRKEQAIEVHLNEIWLPIVHCRCREVPLLMHVVLYSRLLIRVLRHVNRVFHG